MSQKATKQTQSDSNNEHERQNGGNGKHFDFDTNYDLNKNDNDNDDDNNNNKHNQHGEEEEDKDIIKIEQDIKAKLEKVLKNTDNTIKTKEQLNQESKDETCCSAKPRYCCSISNGIYGSYRYGEEKTGKNAYYMNKIDQLRGECEPLKRIEIILDAYHQLLKVGESKERQVLMSDIIQIEGIYEHQQLAEDFQHIQILHINSDNNANRCHDHEEYDKHKYHNIAGGLCDHFAVQFKCHDIATCIAFLRHHREETNNGQQAKDSQFKAQKQEIEDATLQKECDKIHSFFFHSTVKYGTEAHSINTQQEKDMDKNNQYLEKRMYARRIYNKKTSTTATGNNKSNENKDENKEEELRYIGEIEDNLWWKWVSPKEEEKQNEEEIYRHLVENMGVFRWQNPHGFKAEQNRGTLHYKPKYNNIKEEALENEYEQLSRDKWNKTLRKTKVFYNTWARKKIQTQYKGHFNDQVSGHKEEWDEKMDITMQEIVTLKLYTDFDKLQFALKKCFRVETMEDIVQESDDKKDDAQYKKAKQDLKNRLESFYHWRGGLLIVLNKFGTKLNGENNMVLYHGVNAKMIIKASQTFAFNGPLSTSSSYPVARTFATAKGMVLQITSHFPRLNYCNAFDASLISDYPEEQEWLIGFMYVRVLEVRTRKFTDNPGSYQDLLDKVALSSLVRQEFFAVHLFNEQIFSMNEHLERIIAQFLKVNRWECCKNMEKYKHQHDKFGDWGINCMATKIGELAGHPHAEKEMIEIKKQCETEEKQQEIQKQKDDFVRKRKVFPILWKKFNEFRLKPQRIKFDTISDHLKRFFMEEMKDENNNINTVEKQWRISFDEIITVYEYVKEIHFINQYIFDDEVLDNLIKQIKKGKENRIDKIVFSYYNYKQQGDKNKPLNDKIFQDPDTLNESKKDQLEGLGWTISHKQNDETGYKITVFNKNI